MAEGVSLLESMGRFKQTPGIVFQDYGQTSAEGEEARLFHAGVQRPAAFQDAIPRCGCC
jgi:hypothetical protein